MFRNFAAEDLEAFSIWRNHMERRFDKIEAEVLKLKQIIRPNKIDKLTSRSYLSLLREFLSESDAREICFLMHIDWDGLGGDGKRDKMVSLVSSLERQGLLYQFEQLVREARPNVDWPAFV